jgi:hypothetical protein
MKPLFEVTDPYELNALIRVLMQAKFHPDPTFFEVQGSPFVARMCERVVEAYAAAQEDRKLPGDPGRIRATSVDTPPDTVLDTVRLRISECASRGPWREWTTEQRSEFVRLLLSPYTPIDLLVAELVALEPEA